jgi:hypothetical protein
MSGGGGTGYEPPVAIPCGDVDYETTLWSPQPDEVQRLTIGTMLDVDLEESDGTRRVAVTNNGALVGTIAGGQLATLIRCLQADVRFAAEVRNVEGGQVKVRVRPVV